MLAEVVAVVRDEHEHRVVGDAEEVELLHEPAEPAVHHRHLARVGRVAQPYVVFGQTGCAPVVVARLRLPPVVVRGVETRVVLGRIPGLVRVPDVDEQEEALAVVPFEPLLRGGHGAGDPSIRLVPPRGPCIEPLLHPPGVPLAA